METKDRKMTILDVARLAGVSKGTVDRVIHNRGEVSQQSREKVLAVVEEIGYEPNIYASVLSTRRRYRCICLIPDFGPGSFWEIARRGIERAATACLDFNMEVTCRTYDQFDADSFLAVSRTILAERPDAVLVAPMFREPAEGFGRELQHLKIPFVYIDSKVETDAYLAYFGVPTFESGYLGASLLLREQNAGSVGCFRTRRAGDAVSNTATVRFEGFRAYLDEHLPGCQVHSAYLMPHDRAHNTQVLDLFFLQHPRTRHIVSFNSRAHVIAAYLAERGMRDIRLLGYDPLEENVRYMKEGYIEYVIGQRTESQAYRGVMALCDAVVFKKTPPIRDNHMPMDILTCENVDYYFDLSDR